MSLRPLTKVSNVELVAPSWPGDCLVRSTWLSQSLVVFILDPVPLDPRRVLSASITRIMAPETGFSSSHSVCPGEPNELVEWRLPMLPRANFQNIPLLPSMKYRNLGEFDLFSARMNGLVMNTRAVFSVAFHRPGNGRTNLDPLTSRNPARRERLRTLEKADSLATRRANAARGWAETVRRFTCSQLGLRIGPPYALLYPNNLPCGPLPVTAIAHRTRLFVHV
jgi:hypothetical protein